VTSVDLDAAAAVLGSLARRHEPLAPHCTYRAGGPAALWVEVEHRDDLVAVAEAVAASRCPTLVVGKGSNLLVAEAGFAGIALHLGDAFADIDIDTDHHRVMAGGAAFLPVVARRTAAASLTGFEWAVGVPGSIGGAVRMNAGGHGSDMAASVVEVEVFDLATGETSNWSPLDLAFAYRRSAIAPHHLVLSACLQLEPGDRARSESEISEIVRWRRAHQPGGQNAGSVFANPDGDSAGRLIDSLGLKGLRIGTAEVSTKHANFIQVDPDGSGDDVFHLIRELQLRVAAATGVELRPENHLIGFESPESRPADVGEPAPATTSREGS
jgi:UDP-N-acetylmuramate dehydrogenase